MTTQPIREPDVAVQTFADLITSATAEARTALQDGLGRDWNAPAGDVQWSCHDTAAHIADDLVSYASQVVARPLHGYLPIEAKAEDSATAKTLIESMVMCGELLRLAVSAAPPTARAWHPNGTSDPEGFAAMGALEVLVHTYDIARGLGLDWTPTGELCAPVVTRLFPDAPAGDPSEVLLWCTGRTALDDRPRRTGWRWDSTVR